MIELVCALVGVTLVLLAYGIRRVSPTDAQIFGTIGVLAILAFITPMARLMLFMVGAFCIARAMFAGDSHFRIVYLFLGLLFLAPLILLLTLGSMIALSR